MKVKGKYIKNLRMGDEIHINRFDTVLVNKSIVIKTKQEYNIFLSNLTDNFVWGIIKQSDLPKMRLIVYGVKNE